MTPEGEGAILTQRAEHKPRKGGSPGQILQEVCSSGEVLSERCSMLRLSIGVLFFRIFCDLEVSPAGPPEAFLRIFCAPLRFVEVFSPLFRCSVRSFRAVWCGGGRSSKAFSHRFLAVCRPPLVRELSFRVLGPVLGVPFAPPASVLSLMWSAGVSDMPGRTFPSAGFSCFRFSRSSPYVPWGAVPGFLIF